MSETYFSVDVETDGLVPGVNPMLSIGAVAYDDVDFKAIGRFSIVLELMEGTQQDPGTREWWFKFPEARAEARKDPVQIGHAMALFAEWTKRTAKETRAVFCAWPLNFDASFVSYYFHHCGIRNPFGIGGLDIRSLWMGLSGMPYVVCDDELIPPGWVSPFPHTHVAVEDAVEQGHVMVQMLKAARLQQEFRQRMWAGTEDMKSGWPPDVFSGDVVDMLNRIEGR